MVTDIQALPAAGLLNQHDLLRHGQPDRAEQSPVECSWDEPKATEKHTRNIDGVTAGTSRKLSRIQIACAGSFDVLLVIMSRI